LGNIMRASELRPPCQQPPCQILHGDEKQAQYRGFAPSNEQAKQVKACKVRPNAFANCK